MSLEDFEKISNNEFVEKDNKSVKNMFSDFDFEKIEYYLSNMDELLNCLKQSYSDYVNAKAKLEFKKDKLQTSINWSKENALRESNGLPKVTTQTQRDSVINLKLKILNINKESYELKYKFYNKLFNFISNNFELLLKMYDLEE